MALQFDYDWFAGLGYERQRNEARLRCTRKKHPTVTPENVSADPKAKKFFDALEVRTLIYLRDGFSYEMRELVDLSTRSLLTFECEPLDEQYKVGSFIVAVLFEEIVRIEVFAVHPSQKPENTPFITGFRTSPQSDPGGYRDESREPRNTADNERE